MCSVCGDSDPRLIGLAYNQAAPLQILLRLLESGPHDAKAALLSDADPKVRQAATQRQAPTAIIESETELSRWAPQRVILARPLAERLAPDGDADTRARAAAEPSLPADLVDELAIDPDSKVRLAVSRRADLTEEQRAAIDYTDDPGRLFHPLEWVTEACDDAEIMRRCATSAHPALRRSAAHCPHLPPDLVQTLANDEDFLVRLFLAENHPDPPGELLLRTVLEFEGYTRAKMLRHPNFPRSGLHRYATSPDPRERALATMDPHIPPQSIEALSHDADLTVRRSAAADARLPAARLLEMLADDGTAEAAARNPALPLQTMEEILNR
ncbi:hypothetical protein F8568_021785 [Actinomadura sp. LD22]|uniref:Leucine rich repeat variant n=1 Tax=Actinomadura physcomitrii TaxID=2650748 RepID=A0A6I4MDM7_9ACTN|nr:hypothetical protein [Actinomadura physcomitrii]MWA02960.1 hypothetical protein [Actinomadura physcomitrii]